MTEGSLSTLLQQSWNLWLSSSDKEDACPSASWLRPATLWSIWCQRAAMLPNRCKETDSDQINCVSGPGPAELRIKRWKSCFEWFGGSARKTGGGQMCDTLKEHQQSELNSCNSCDILWLSINFKELRKYSFQFTNASSANIKLLKNQGWGQALKRHLVKINMRSKRFLKCTEKNRYPLQWFIQSQRFKNICKTWWMMKNNPAP